MSALHAWLSDWRGTARIVIRRRDQLLRLGIGKRRARAAEDDTDVPEPPVTSNDVTHPEGTETQRPSDRVRAA